MWGTRRLEVDVPEVVGRILQFEAEFPAVASLVSAPDEDGFGFAQADGVDDLKLLAYGESVRGDGHAAPGADVYGLAFDGLCCAGFLPGETNRDARVDAHSGAGELQGLCGFSGHRWVFSVFLVYVRGCGGRRQWDWGFGALD